MSTSKKDRGGISHLIRTAGHQAKAIAENMAGQGSDVATTIEGRSTRIFNVIQYAESSWGLQMQLFPVQRFIVKLYYNLPLDDKVKTITITNRFKDKILYQFTEVEYLHFLHAEGRCNIGEQDHMRRTLILPIGRRSGKTHLSAVFASYELYRLLTLGNPQDYYGLPSGNRIQIISVATDKDQASLLYNEVTGHLAKCEFFEPYKANVTQSLVNFRTPYDIEKYGPTVRHENGKFTSTTGKASLRITFKASVSKGLRGSGNIVIILDEMAHFQDTGVSSAKDVYDAVAPSAMAFSPKDPNDKTQPIGEVQSRIICISSPLNRAGKFYDLFHFAMSNAEGSENMLAIQAPTWEVNPTVEPSFLREKYHEDPSVFDTEFGAAFTDRRRGWIEREQDLLDCIKPDLRPKAYGPPRLPHQMGIDVGLVDDGTSVAITHLEGDKVVLDYHEVWYAGQSWKESNPHLIAPMIDYPKTLEMVERIDFDAISDWIYALSKKFYISDGLFDRWNGLPLEQTLHKMGLKQFRSEFFNRDSTSKMYQSIKLLMFDRRLVLYDYPVTHMVQSTKHSPLIAELLTLQQTQMSKNQIVVEAPQSTGFHDDLSDAFVRAAWLSLERFGNIKLVSPSGIASTGGARYLTSSGYQRARMRSHGVVMDRMVPRGFRR